MNWQECIESLEPYGIRSRFEWPAEGLAGFNCQDGVTISDAWGLIAWLWTWPSDWLLRLPSVNAFFELDPLHTGGTASGILTFALIYAFLFGIALIGGLLTS